MHRSVFFILLAGLCLAFAGTAGAQVSRFYLASYLGLNTYPSDQHFSESSTGTSGNLSYKNVPSFAGALGIHLNRNLRVEAELSFRNTNLDDAQFNGGNHDLGGRDRTIMAMANVYYDFNLNWKNFTPFVTAGLGMADHDLDVIDQSGSLPQGGGRSLGFAYQAGAGLLYRINPQLAFTGDYRFVGTSDIDAGNYKLGYHSNEFRLGLQYSLPVTFLK